MLWHIVGGARLISLNFTGMGGPMGVYDGYDTDRCESGGTRCVARDNEGNYGANVGGSGGWAGGAGGPHGPGGGAGGGGAGGGGKKGFGNIHPCPPAFDCNGIPPKFYHNQDGANDEFW